MTSPTSPVTLGATTAANRIFMAPMTRSRAAEGGLATELMAEYYTQRASAGLIITEGIQPNAIGQGYLATPGLHTAEQVASWRTVTDAVHAAGGKIFAQLMHCGRVSHPSLHGFTPASPSAVKAPGSVFTGNGLEDTVLPHELSDDEILATIADHATAARNAIEAGFDGVEVHGANGYLTQQFLSSNVNTRTDRWGGSVENHIRFAVEVVKAMAEEIGADRVGLRISPGSSTLGIVENNPEELYTALLTALSEFPLAYVHARETEGRELTRKIRAAWCGPLILNPQFDAGRAPHLAVADVLGEGVADAVAFAGAFLANPDLPARIKSEGPYNTPDSATFYGGDAAGYTDYAALV